MKWFDASKTLPPLTAIKGEFSHDVIIWDGETMGIGYYCDLGYWFKHGDTYSEVTHWGNLPKPPNNTAREH